MRVTRSPQCRRRPHLVRVVAGSSWPLHSYQAVVINAAHAIGCAWKIHRALRQFPSDDLDTTALVQVRHAVCVYVQ